MSRLSEAEYHGTEEHIFPCDCGDYHYLRIRWDEDPQWRSLWIEDLYHPHGLKERLRVIWGALRGRETCYREIILTEKSIASLKEFVESRE